LKKNNIESVIIGNITEDKNIIIKDGKEEEVDPPDSDELFKIMK